ncbi:MAG TPA: polysaccharide deacetylase family protein [Lachnospiraceae bacterium]|nr:polysaccharide deacetylase family protein [Lachnospiraceae bacterium]
MENKKLIALTFDDGPNTGTSMEVLDILAKHQVKASFFLIGNLITKETIPVILREVEMGCEIHNHSWTHPFMNKMTEEEIRQEIIKTSEKIIEITGKEPRFFRPPFIEVNDLMYDVIDMPFICGQGVEDWVPHVSAEERAKRVLDQAVDGSIVLLHDLQGNINTVEALDTIIPELKKREFEFVTVSELFEKKNEPIKSNPGKLYSVV